MSQSLIQQARDIAADQYIRLEIKRASHRHTYAEWADHIQRYSDFMRRGFYDHGEAVQSTLVALRSAAA